MGILSYLSPMPSVGLSLVGQSVRWVSCGKMADWIWMPFGVVSGVGRGMDVLDGSGDWSKGRGTFGVNVWRSIVTNGNFVEYFVKVHEVIELSFAAVSVFG